MQRPNPALFTIRQTEHTLLENGVRWMPRVQLGIEVKKSTPIPLDTRKPDHTIVQLRFNENFFRHLGNLSLIQ
jgi:hypothetical protein